MIVVFGSSQMSSVIFVSGKNQVPQIQLYFLCHRHYLQLKQTPAKFPGTLLIRTTCVSQLDASITLGLLDCISASLVSQLLVFSGSLIIGRT